MSTLDRYKKKGGFIQLLNLLETTGVEKRDKFFKMIADENPAWEVELKKKMLTMDKICSWNASYLMEIFPRVPHQNLAAIIAGSTPDRQQVLLAALPFADRRKVETIVAEKKPNAGEVNASIMRLMGEIRTMAQKGSLKFEKFDQDMVIPEDIEELLASGRVLISDKDVDSSFASMPGLPAATGGNGASNEELTLLRRRMMQLAQENQKLVNENIGLKDKLEQIRKIA